MIRLSKLADYGIVIMTHMAQHKDEVCSTQGVAMATNLPQPTASKILKVLARGGLLVSHRGAQGGYGLARSAMLITVADIIESLDGPIALTDCVDDGIGECGIESLCPAKANWQQINNAIRDALDGISLDEMTRSIPEAFLRDGDRRHPTASV